MTISGTMALEDGASIDFAKLRRDRQDRVFAAMEHHELDALLLSQPANRNYVSGSRTLWKAARGSFVPAAAVVRETRQVHVMGRWDPGVPDTVPFEHIYPMSWNPATILEGVAQALGRAGEGRVGVDQMSAGFAAMLSQALPKASLVDGGPAMMEARLVKTEEERRCLRTSTAIAEGALAEAVASVAPGVPEQELLGIFQRKATDYGVTAPLAQSGMCVQDTEGDATRPPFHEMTSRRPLHAGDLVNVTGGVLYTGYASDVGRTCLCGGEAEPAQAQRDLYQRWREAYGAMAEVCVPGKTAADLRRAFEALEPLPPVPVAHGLGQGYEPPIAGTGLGDETESRMELEQGMAVVLQPYVWRRGAGGFWAKETLLITDTGHERLTTLAHGPLARD